MKKTVLFVLSFVVWLFLTAPFHPQGVDWQSFGVGLVVSFLVGLIFGEMFTETPHKFLWVSRYLWALYYLPVFAYACLLANLDVAYRVLHPALPIRPGIVKVKSRLRSKSGLTALANSITLTPGTMSVEVTEDGYLYIHWINVLSQDVEEASRLIVERFERILERIFE
ncbi:MAG TPA: Na+/H+ antiporter subunit E [bacterium]|nr:Na+/H+ antiporter subunit E [bacterium]HOL65984.1 Na+/H+ antiporter subunit E [bacterium]HPP11219.1 Na+/H+ antiporter subunit E [bacterium]